MRSTLLAIVIAVSVPAPSVFTEKHLIDFDAQIAVGAAWAVVTTPVQALPEKPAEPVVKPDAAKVCPACDGTGKTGDGLSTCPACKGTGRKSPTGALPSVLPDLLPECDPPAEAPKPAQPLSTHPLKKARLSVYSPKWCSACPKQAVFINQLSDAFDIIYYKDEASYPEWVKTTAKSWPFVVWDGVERQWGWEWAGNGNKAKADFQILYKQSQDPEQEQKLRGKRPKGKKMSAAWGSPHGKVATRFRAFPSGGHWSYPGDIYSHLINEHGMTSNDLEHLTGEQMEYLHDSLHTGRKARFHFHMRTTLFETAL